MAADAVGIGLLGFGTIGTGVVRVLARNAEVISERLGFGLRLVRIADLDTSRDRGVSLDGIRFDADAEGLVDDPAVQIVIELIGGYDAARRLTLRALAADKPVVTANKALLAVHGKEIFGAARRAGVDVAFEASVGGGIPILRSVREGLAANRIESLHGIMNGTTNYVLSEMETTGELFEVVLKRDPVPVWATQGTWSELPVSTASGGQLYSGQSRTIGSLKITPVATSHGRRASSQSRRVATTSS